VKAALLALQFLTRLPLPAVAASERDFAHAIRWFALAGVVVGALVAAAAFAGARRDPWAGALLALIGWVWITGALHLDGLGDIADGAGAAHGNRERLSAVLADPHIGSFGVVAIGLQLIAKLVALRLFLAGHSPALLVLVPAIARIAPLGWALALPPLHAGLGARMAGGARGWVLALWSLLAIAAAWRWCPALLVAAPAAMLWGLWLRRRIGGISGDGHGAGIELLETAMLLAAACA